MGCTLKACYVVVRTYDVTLRGSWITPALSNRQDPTSCFASTQTAEIRSLHTREHTQLCVKNYTQTLCTRAQQQTIEHFLTDSVADKHVTLELTNHNTDMERLRRSPFIKWNHCSQWNHWVCKTSCCLGDQSSPSPDNTLYALPSLRAEANHCTRVYTPCITISQWPGGLPSSVGINERHVEISTPVYI